MSIAQDTYEVFRLSLMLRDQRGISETAMSRQEHIERMFGETRTFEHWARPYTYTPQAAPLAASDRAIIVGGIGRAFVETENAPPEEGFAPREHSGWRATAVLVDPREHEDGQKVAMRRDEKVGSSLQLLRAFADDYNEATKATSPYVVDIEPIFDGSTFWSFVEENKGNVTTVAFRFVAPNMWKGQEELEADVRDMRDKEGARKVEIVIKNPGGLRTDTPRIRQGVRYAERGGGSVTARSKNGKRFNSKKRSRVVKTPADRTENVFQRALGALRKLFS